MKYFNKNEWKTMVLNKENFFVVIDFDKTITSADSEDSWDASGKTLGDDFKEKMNSLYKYYAPIEVDYTLEKEKKEKLMEEWYTKCMNLYFEYKLTKEQLLQSVRNSNVIFREGAQEFICNLNKYNIPIIIVSAGIGNTIEQFLKDNNCLCDNVYIVSNFIEFDDNGNMKKFNNNMMIHSLNKTMEEHIPTELKEKLLSRNYRILLGDLVDDIKMINSKYLKKTIKIGILNSKIEENLSIYNNNFDIVLTGKDATFYEIMNLLDC